MNIENMESKLFKALSHPSRLAIVKSLLNETKCVCELVDIIGISQSNLSQHISILRDANIIKQERDGTRINCLVNHKEIGNIINDANKIVKNEINNMLNEI